MDELKRILAKKEKKPIASIQFRDRIFDNPLDIFVKRKDYEGWLEQLK